MAKTVEVRRGGSYLTIPVDAIDRYLAKGYDVVDASGRVVKESVPNDVNVLKMAYEKHTAKIKELEAEVAKLKKQLSEAAIAKAEPVAEAKPEVATEVKTVRRKKA